LREPDERPEDFLAPLTAPDFFVEEVRLVAAAARFVVAFPEVRAFEAELLAAPFAAPRLEERAEDFAAERAPVERDAPDLALEREAVFEPPRAAVEREVADFLAADLVDLAGDFAAEEREVNFAAVFFAPDLAEDLAAVLVDREVDLAAVFVPAFLEAVLFEPDFEAPFAALERDEEPVDFAALLRAVEPVLFLAAPLFLAPDLELLEEPRRVLLFLDLVLVAPVSPVNSIVSGFDLSSVGIAASFKGLRVQPSRLQGNVVIPRRFRLTESVGSRTRTISVDISYDRRTWTYGFDDQ
jgi:hypothetical protein